MAWLRATFFALLYVEAVTLPSRLVRVYSDPEPDLWTLVYMQQLRTVDFDWERR